MLHESFGSVLITKTKLLYVAFIQQNIKTFSLIWRCLVFGDSERLRRIKRRALQDIEDHEGKVNDSIKKGRRFCKDQSVRNGNFNSALSTLSAEWYNKESDMAAQMNGEKRASSAWPQITCTTGVIKPFVGDISSCISGAGIVFMLSVCLCLWVCHHGKMWSQHQLWEELPQRQLWALWQAYKNLTLCVWTQQSVVKVADTQLCSCVVVIKIKTSTH